MPEVKKSNDPLYMQPEKWAWAKCTFYECAKCLNPFFGGLKDCERDLNLEANTKKEDLICKACIAKQIGGGEYNCPTHGHKHIIWKCMKCCAEALFRCKTLYMC